MTDEHQADGWRSVPHVDAIRGTAPGEHRQQGQPGHQPQQPPAQPHQQQFPAQPHQPQPHYEQQPRPRRRRRTVVALVAGGAALVLLLVAGVVGYSSGTASHSADRPVRAFLDDLTAGHVAKALRAADVEHDRDDVLLTDAAYAKATDRVTGYRVVDVRQQGDTATVTTTLRQGGRDVPATFTLDRSGNDWGVFPVWELQAPRLGSVAVSVRGPSGTPLEVAGRSTTTSKDGTATLTALPGTYDVAIEGGKWVESTTASATVTGFGGTASSPVAMTAALTSAGRQAAERAVDAWVDGCIASHDPAPSGCSFYAYGEDPAYTYSNERWTLDSRPVVSVGEWSAEGWLVTTTTLGRARFTADISGPDGVGTASAGPLNVSASGYVTGFDASGATFRSAVGSSAPESGS